MRLNVSAVKLFQTCRVRWYYQYVLNRVPLKPMLALDFGKAYHRIMEEHFLGLGMADAIWKIRDEVSGPITMASFRDEGSAPMSDVTLVELRAAQDVVKMIDKFEEVLLLWKDTYPVTQLLEVEESFEYDYKGVTLVGRPDRGGVVFGKTMHIQNRSLAGGNIALYRNLARWDMHELLYAWALAKKYPERPYGGTLFNIMKKVQYRGKPTKKVPEGKILRPIEEILYQFPVTMTQDRIDKCLEDLLWVAEEMARTRYEIEKKGYWPAANRAVNGGPYGNSYDPYVDVIDGKVSLDDNTRFEARENMYPEAPNDKG